MRLIPSSVALAAVASAVILVWAFGLAENVPTSESPARLQGTNEISDADRSLWTQVERRAAPEPARSEVATVGEPSPTESSAAEGGDFAFLLLDAAGPRPDLRVELWFATLAQAGDGAEEKIELHGVESTDARGWLLWERLPYGRYVVCEPLRAGHRGYRGPGVTGPRLGAFEHRAELVAERVIQVEDSVIR